MHKKIVVPLYGTRVDLFSSPESCNEFFGKEVFTEGSEAISHTHTQGVYLAFRDSNPNSVTHECVHAAWRVLHWNNVKVSRTNHEALAYVAGWLAEQVTAFLKKAEKI